MPLEVMVPCTTMPSRVAAAPVPTVKTMPWVATEPISNPTPVFAVVVASEVCYIIGLM